MKYRTRLIANFVSILLSLIPFTAGHAALKNVIYKLPQIDLQPSNAWKIPDSAGKNVEGYVGQTSVLPGDQLDVYINTKATKVNIQFFRMGWYGGRGAALAGVIKNVQSTNSTIPPKFDGIYRGLPPKKDSLFQASFWDKTATISVPKAWPSGMYLAKVTTSKGDQSYLPFVVRGTGAVTSLLIHTIFTDMAYDDWGGGSFYKGYTYPVSDGHAVLLPIQRPFNQDRGAGSFFCLGVSHDSMA